MIVLASASAARTAMLSAAGVVHDVQPAHVDETSLLEALAAEGAPAERIADALAELKAVKVSRARPADLVIGADSVVVTADGRMLEKPGTVDKAIVQLRDLSGTSHRLVSAVVIAEVGRPTWRAVGAAKLTMRRLSDGFIADYLAAEGAGVLGCVGTYRIEGRGAQLFTDITGDQFTIRGLPLLALLGQLHVRGFLPA